MDNEDYEMLQDDGKSTKVLKRRRLPSSLLEEGSYSISIKLEGSSILKYKKEEIMVSGIHIVIGLRYGIYIRGFNVQ